MVGDRRIKIICPSFVPFFFILKFGTILQRKEKGGKREFKKTTNIKYNREKKETKKVLHFFSFMGSL